MSALDDYAETMIAPRISMVSGVSQVQVQGAQKYAVRVQVDPDKLHAQQIGINEVDQALQNWNVNLPTGQLFGPHATYNIKAAGPADERRRVQADHRRLPQRRAGPPRPGRQRHRQRREHVYNGNWFYTKDPTAARRAASITLQVMRQPGSNTIEVTDAVRALLPGVRGAAAAVGPPDVRGRTARRTIREAFSDIQVTMLVTLVLVVGVIFLFLHNGSATLIPALALPFSILGTFAVMQVLNFSLNNLSMMALILSIGFVVDDAIVMLENIVRHIEDGESPLEAALKGSKEIGFTILTMTDVARRRVHPDPVHERHPRPAVPRVRRHDHGRDPDLGRGVGHADADAVQPVPARRAQQEGLRRADGPRVRRAARAATSGASASSCATGSPCWSSSSRVLAATVQMFRIVPNGFIPDQDNDSMFINLRPRRARRSTTCRSGRSRSATSSSRNPYVDSFIASVGGGRRAAAARTTAACTMQLMPRASARHDGAADRPADRGRSCCDFPGSAAFVSLPPALQIGGRMGNRTYSLTVQSADTDELYSWAPKLEQADRSRSAARCRTSRPTWR